MPISYSIGKVQCSKCYIETPGRAVKCHPIMRNVTTAREVQKLRVSIKMLSGDYLTFAVKSRQNSGSSDCRLCQDPVEDLVHVLCRCPSSSDSRKRILNEISSLLSEASDDNSCKILDSETVKNLFSDEKTLTQFILDCTSYNLPNTFRYNVNDPKVTKIFSLARDLCFTVHTTRIRLLRELKNTTAK